MYEKFYGFKEKPFNTTPDSRFFFPSSKHTEALSTLSYTISERKGFAVITGEIGSGKTSVCRVLLNQLNSGTKVAMITNTHLSKKELISSILEDLEVSFKPGTKTQLLSCLNRFLIEQLSLNFNVILIIDEAQNLKPSVLEEIRMLSNLETEREKLLQIILVGQPELKDKLELKRLEQFKQRIGLFFHISPLDRKETEKYITHRLRIVDWTVDYNGGRTIFSPETIDEIYNYTGGVPRIINLLCDYALLTGYINNKRNISPEVIEQVASDLRLKKNTTN